MKKRRLLALLLAGVMSISSFPVSALADDAPKPAEPSYVFDGVTYVNLGNEESTSQGMDSDYYYYMLNNPLNTNKDVDFNGYGDLSFADLWTKVGFVAIKAKRYSTPPGRRHLFWYYPVVDNTEMMSIVSQHIPENLATDYSGKELKYQFDNGLDRESIYFYKDKLRSAQTYSDMIIEVADSAARAINELHDTTQIIPHPVRVKKINDPDNVVADGNKMVFFMDVGAAGFDLDDWDYNDDMNLYAVIAAFSDFKVVPIIPSGSSDNNVYKRSVKDNTSTDDGSKYVSDISNRSSREANATQSITETRTTSLSNSINGSETLEIGTEIKIGTEVEFLDSFKSSMEITTSIKNSVEKGWAKEETEENSKETSSEISVTLPPYSTILMSQKQSESVIRSEFNCPLGLSFKVDILGVYGEWDDDDDLVDSITVEKVTSFAGGTDARTDFADRFAREMGTGSLPDKDVNMGTVNYYCGPVVDILTNTVPFEETDATFTERINVVKSEVEDILPIYMIDRIIPEKQNGDKLYTLEMEVGDFDYADDINLKALNNKGAEFATFDQDKGHFIITDAKGKEDKSGGIVSLETNAVSGHTKYTAKGPGTVYLRYVIDEDVYQTAAMAALSDDNFIKNADIKKPAVIQINVKEAEKEEEKEPENQTEKETEKPTEKETEKQTEELDTISGAVNDKTANEMKPITVQVNVTTEAAAKPETKKETASVKKANVYAKMTAKGDNKEVISWKRVPNAAGYQVYFAECNDENYNTCRLVKTTNSNTFKYVKKNLKTGTPYKAYVKAFAKVNGKKVTIGKSLLLHSVTGNEAGKYTNAAKIKGGKTSVSVKAGKTVKLKGQKLVLKKKGLKRLQHCAKFRYVSSNKKIATVSSSGKITGVKKGSCKVYIFAANGVRKTVNVKVK